LSEKLFADQKVRPKNADLREAIGPPFLLIEEVLSGLQSEFQNISCEWKFSKTSGWYVTYNKGKKRLFYLFPGNGDFLLKLVFNDRALEEIRGGDFPKYFREMIRGAKKYPEGTLCEFTRKNFKAATMLELLRIKVST
jgi:hypothetical protein